MKRFIELSESDQDDATVEYPGHWFAHYPGKEPYVLGQSTLELRLSGPFKTQAEAEEGKPAIVSWISSSDDPRMRLPVMTKEDAEKKGLSWKMYREVMFQTRKKFFR